VAVAPLRAMRCWYEDPPLLGAVAASSLGPRSVIRGAGGDCAGTGSATVAGVASAVGVGVKDEPLMLLVLEPRTCLDRLRLRGALESGARPSVFKSWIVLTPAATGSQVLPPSEDWNWLLPFTLRWLSPYLAYCHCPGVAASCAERRQPSSEVLPIAIHSFPTTIEHCLLSASCAEAATAHISVAPKNIVKKPVLISSRTLYEHTVDLFYILSCQLPDVGFQR